MSLSERVTGCEHNHVQSSESVGGDGTHMADYDCVLSVTYMTHDMTEHE